jgi:hypothetical protein
MITDGDKLASDIVAMTDPLSVQKETAIALHRVAIALEELAEIPNLLQYMGEHIEDIDKTLLKMEEKE